MLKNSEKVKSVLDLILIFIWILSGGGVLYVLERNPAIAILSLYTLILFIIYRPKIKNVLINVYVYTILSIVFVMWVCYVFGVQPQDITKYAYILAISLFGGVMCIYLFSSFTYTEFLKLFYKALNIIRIHAIASFLFMPFLLSHSFIVSNDTEGFQAYTFKYLFFLRTDQYAFNLLGKALYRNQGLFWEPGVLQFYLNLFLFLQLYIIKSKRANILLTVFAIITTYSTSAYACMLLILSVYILSLIRKEVFAGIFTVMAFLGVLPFFIGNFENKFQGNNETSANVRLFDFAEQLLVIKDHFLTGVGMDNGQYAVIRTNYQLSGSLASLSFNGNERGSTNSVMLVLGTMGIFMGGWWLFAYTKQQFVQGIQGKKIIKIILTIFLLLAVSVEPLLLKPFFMTFIISGMFFTYVKLKYPQVKSLWKGEY